MLYLIQQEIRYLKNQEFHEAGEETKTIEDQRNDGKDHDIKREGIKRADRMRKSLAAGDLKAYQIEAHAAKSNMATIGLTDFCERAKRHEFAAKENNMTFIREDGEDFINDYLWLCQKLGGLLCSCLNC